MAKQNMVLVQVNIQIPEQDVQAIKDAAKRETGAAISAVASDLVHKYAQGGIMLDRRSIEEIEGATGQSIASQQAIVDEIRTARSISRDGVIAHATIEPGYLMPLTDVATANGMTLQQYVDLLFGIFLSEGYVINLTDFGVRHVVFSRDQMDELSAAMGGTVTAEKILELAKQPAGK